MSTLAIAERVRDGAIATRRKLYNGCFHDMGLQTGIAARLVHPEKQKRALADEVCTTLVQNSVLRLPAPRDTLIPELVLSLRRRPEITLYVRRTGRVS